MSNKYVTTRKSYFYFEGQQCYPLEDALKMIKSAKNRKKTELYWGSMPDEEAMFVYNKEEDLIYVTHFYKEVVDIAESEEGEKK